MSDWFDGFELARRQVGSDVLGGPATITSPSKRRNFWPARC